MLSEIKKQSDSDVEEPEESQEIFGKISMDNKENTMAVQEGDILIPAGRSATTCTQCLWPISANGTVFVPYNFAFNYSDWQINLFKTSMQEYETLTCVRFVPRTTENDFLNIVSSRGCAAGIGRGGGGQMLAVDTAGCMYRGVIQHELNHALGFYHEQSRSDRDNYVQIMYQYISPGDRLNFKKAETNNLGLEYDYGSVMHYDMYEFSNTSGKPSIVPIPDPNVPIGQRDGLSVLDVSKINRLYNCSNICANLLNNNNGTLTSTNYPSAYPNNANCVWLVRTPSNQVSLNFVAFDVQSSPNCVSDYIRIYDGPTKNYPLLLDRTCGTALVPPIIASTSQALVEFSSDSGVTGVGFKASYSSVQCGGTFYLPGKTISSPNFPNSYGPNMNCTFTITAPVGNRIFLTFTFFQLEQSFYCMYDSIRMQDGTLRFGPFCGSWGVPDITSTGNVLQLIFVTDGSNQFTGFQASYQFI